MNKAKILVVEDENVVALDIERCLQNLGYGVVGLASSAEKALAKAAKDRPDLVLMDIRLKGAMDGVEAAEQLRQRFNLPVVYLTAYADETTLQRAKVTQPFGYLLKPFDPRLLEPTLEMALYKHRTENKLQEGERRFATALKSIVDGVVTTAGNGSVSFMNPVAEALTGWKLEEALGKDVTEVFQVINPETRHPLESPVLRAMRQGGQVGLAKHSLLIARNGTEIPVEESAAPIRDERGTVDGAVLVFRDVSHRQWAEKALIKNAEELARSNADLEQFAYVASHDLQEPLRMVALYAQLLAQRYRGQLDGDADEFIGYIVNGAQRLHQRINDLLDFSRVGSRGLAFEPTDCKAVLDRVLTDLQTALQDSGASVTHGPLPTVPADSLLLGQVFQNLIGNALKFRGAEPPRVHVSAELEGQQWVFSVRDNGIGIEREYAERIFVIFQRLHSNDAYPGTGIGLAICKRIVERHGGRIWVESEPRQGATFFFNLPNQRRRRDRRLADRLEATTSRAHP
jgi:PAS domain S-box-containing protein